MVDLLRKSSFFRVAFLYYEPTKFVLSGTKPENP